MSGWIISSSVLIAAVVILRAIFRKRISPTLRYALWLLVLLRLLLPVNIAESSVSILNHVPEFMLEESRGTAPIAAGEELPFSPYILDNAETEPAIQAAGGGELLNAAENTPPAEAIMRALYIAGAVVVFGLTMASNIHFASRLKRSRREAGSFMGLRVYRSAMLDSPCLFGLFSPAIYLSEDVDEESCYHVLLHEQAHYRQGDHVWAWLRCIALALHWYNPLVWLAARLSKQDGELSCDGKVLNSIDSAGRISYGQTLIALSCGGKRALLCAVTPISSKGRALKERVEFVAKRPSLFLGSMAMVVLAVLIVAGCTFTGAKTDMPEMTSAPINAPQGSENGEGALLDRDGELLTPDNFQLYDSAASSFDLYLDNSSTVSMTIDLELQKKAQALLEEYMASTGEYVRSGCLVVLDVRTGAPLAIAGKAELADPLAVSLSPGGLFYPCTAITALDVGVIEPKHKIKCEGVFDRYAQDGIAPECWIHKVNGSSHPEEDLSTALRDNCEYYFYCLGNDNGIDDMERTAQALGLGVHSGIELPSSTGLMPSRLTAKGYGMDWNIGNTLETAVGEGMCSFTPLQLAQYCATIANNGTRYSASAIKEIRLSDGDILHSRSPLVLSQISNVDAQGWAAVKEGLFLSLNTEDVLFQNAMTELMGDWRVAGKQSSATNSGLMTKNIFMGYAPYDDPRIAVVAVSITEDETGPATQMAYELISAYKNLQ